MKNIWGIGPATTEYLAKMGIRTALEFAQLPEGVVRKRFTKPGIEIWQELRGESVYPVIPEEKSSYASISKTKTFAPSTNEPAYLFAHLLRNFESACIKARRYSLAPRRIMLYLKKHNFDYRGNETRLVRPSVYPLELADIVREIFDSIYDKRDLYRGTGVVLFDLVPDSNIQYSLFEDKIRAEKVRDIYKAADILGSKFGKHAIHLGGSHEIERRGKGRRGEPTVREQTRLKGETKRRHLGLPIVHVKV